MKPKQVVALCILSALLGSLTTYLLLKGRANPPPQEATPRFALFPDVTDPKKGGFPIQEELESSFFQQFFGENPSFFFSQPILQNREDNEFHYFEIPLKENQRSKIRADVREGMLEIEGEIQEESGDETSSARRTTQRSFSQIVPLPENVDPKSLQIISEPTKTVIRFQKR